MSGSKKKKWFAGQAGAVRVVRYDAYDNLVISEPQGTQKFRLVAEGPGVMENQRVVEMGDGSVELQVGSSTQRSLNAHRTFPQCSLNVHRTFPKCAPNIP
jgi:hypothetical protein